MMRSFYLLGACLVGTAHADITGTCVLNGGQAVSDLMDAGLYTWAASQRCDKGPTNVVKCEVDVASAVESVNRMVNVIMRSSNECGTLKEKNPECSLAAGKLTADIAGIAAAAGSIVQQCPNSVQKKGNFVSRDDLKAAGQSLKDPNWPLGEEATCFVDVKDSMAQLFKAANEITAAKQECHDEDKCAYDVMGIMSAFAGLGRFLMGALGHCDRGAAVNTKDFPLACAESIDNLIGQFAGFVSAAKELSVVCKPKVKTVVVTVEVPVPSQKLYDKAHSGDAEQDKEAETSTNTLNTALVMFLPVVAIVSFARGVRARAHTCMSEELEMLVAVEETIDPSYRGVVMSDESAPTE